MAKKFLFLFLLLLPFSAQGQAGSIVINEIAWMGTPVAGVEEKQWWRYEWVELYNTKDYPLQVDRWSIELYRGDELYFQIPLGGTVPPQGFLLVGASDKIPGADVNYSNLGGKFLNTGQKVVLKNSLGEVVDEIDARTGWLTGDNKTKQTMERVAGSDPATWQTSAEQGGTPKAQNSTGVEPKLSFQGKLSFNATATEPVAFVKENMPETKKDLRGSSSNASPLFIAVPGALLAGVLALAARRFLLRQV